jgi:hypothetical protein
MQNKYKFLVIFFLLISHVAWADDGVDITDPDLVSALLETQKKLDSISSSVMSCINSGNDHKVCMCENETLILDFNTAVIKLFEMHPELGKLDLVRLKTTDGTSVAQSLSGIKMQASSELSCP